MRSFAYYTKPKPRRGQSTAPEDAALRHAFENHAIAAGLTLAAIGVDVVPGARRDFGAILDGAEPGDVLILRSLGDVLALDDDEWQRLRRFVAAGLRLVVLDIVETYPAADPAVVPIAAAALGGVVLAVYGATSRADRLRHLGARAEGVERARQRGAYPTKLTPVARQQISTLLDRGARVREVVETTGASAYLVGLIRKEMQLAA